MATNDTDPMRLEEIEVSQRRRMVKITKCSCGTRLGREKSWAVHWRSRCPYNDAVGVDVTGHFDPSDRVLCERCEQSGWGRALFEVNGVVALCGRCYGVVRGYYANPEQVDPK